MSQQQFAHTVSVSVDQKGPEGTSQPLCFQSPGWYRATTLKERLASLRKVENTANTPSSQTEHDRAARRLARWRLQAPFATGPFFHQRLARDGMTEDDLRVLLGEPIEAVRDRMSASPAWLQELREAYASIETDPHNLCRLMLQDQPFLAVVEPPLEHGRQRLREGIQALIHAESGLRLDVDQVVQLFVGDLSRRLHAMLDRVMVLELHVARLQGLLAGTTPEERFQSFTRWLRERDTRLSILEEYPVLARQATICIDQWVESSQEFLRHLCADWLAIRSEFGSGQASDELVGVNGGMGDSHRKGRSVLIADFASGMKVVYKPRSLAVDVHFQQLLAWVNQRGSHPQFRTLKLLDRDGYGWVEFVRHDSCHSRDEIERFYQRQGGYLAILYALQAGDLHAENLIAAGEYPVLLDLEALFHPSLDEPEQNGAEQLVGMTLDASVLRVGLLPHRLWSTADSEGVDISGLGGQRGQLWPHSVPYWEASGTDQMHVEHKRMEIPASQNRPSINGSDIDVSEFTDSIVSGFSSMYQLMLDHREELLASDGPLAPFADDVVRVILRPTQAYSVLLDRSFHPDLLRDALDRDRLFDNLWVPVPLCSQLARVTEAERRDLHQGDIPVFATHSGSRDLWTSSGERITDYFCESGFDRARRCFRQLSAGDLQRQNWLISASLATLSSTEGRIPRPSCRLTESDTGLERAQLLAAARRVGDRLVSLALRGVSDASWIGFTASGNDRGKLLPLGPDLYDGLPGVALFLAQLGALTSEARYTDLARRAMTTLRSRLRWGARAIPTIGAFAGWGGMIYTLTHLGALWDQPQLLSEAERIVEFLPALIDRDGGLDIISGSAGCAACLLGLWRHAPSDRTLDVARRCGDRLLARATAREEGIGWMVEGQGGQPLTGFSHGAAGVACVLLELAAVTGHVRFRQAACDAIDFERSVFSISEGNWPDFRRHGREDGSPRRGSQRSFMTAWCHGAPGIGLARLRSLAHMDDKTTREEINVALQTTIRSGFGANHCLCHGDLGNLELLLTAGEVLASTAWKTRTNRVASGILDSVNRQGWQCGAPHGVESPGLMTGIAGIGYQLLRIARPDRVPSVLSLEGPKLT